MTEIQRITERFAGANGNLDALWAMAHDELSHFGVTGIFYGQLASASEVKTTNHFDDLPVPVGLISKTSYSADYFNAFHNGDAVETDPTVVHCLTSNEVLAWEYNAKWAEQNPWYKARYAKERDLGYHKGCTIPASHFSPNWVGGIGLAMTDIADSDYALFLPEKLNEIVAICGLLDECIRSDAEAQFVGLTGREKECLTWLAAGLSPQQITHNHNISTSRVDKLIGQAKKKLRARTRDHAVVRALLLGIIHP